MPLGSTVGLTTTCAHAGTQPRRTRWATRNRSATTTYGAGFFATAARALVEHDAIVDRFVGDQAIGIFVPALTGTHHAARSIQAAQAVVAGTGHGTGAPWIPVGAGVHTGIAFVGSVGSGSHVGFTALGDTVNTAARLASAAGPGEILVTPDAVHAADLDVAGLERRDLALKGKRAPTPDFVLTST